MTAAERVTAQVRALLAEWTCEVDTDGAAPLAERINGGECGAFAEVLVERLYEEERLNAFDVATDDFMRDACKRPHNVDGVHVWTYVPETGRHYDAEAPEGVEDWMALPFFGRWRERHKIERAASPEEEAERLRVSALAWSRCRAEIARRVGR